MNLRRVWILIRRIIFFQLKVIQEEILPKGGSENVFCVEGYEADDIMAVVCRRLGGEIFLVSSDKDLFQLLNDRVSIFEIRKKRIYTEKDFLREWKIPPSLWAEVLAIAGCGSDNIRGIFGIGKKFAVKYLRGELGEKKCSLIRQGLSVIDRNRKLVTLPFERFPVDSVKVVEGNGIDFSVVMKSLANFGIRRIYY